MGGGLPLGGVVGSPSILSTLSADPPLCHVTTFGGNPVSCAAGLAAIEILVNENLAARAAETGTFLKRELGSLVGSGGLVEVRGLGLMLGLRFDSSAACHRFVTRCLEGDLLVGWTLHGDDLVRLTPPLVLSFGEARDALARMRQALE
jgi:acetylornithine/succinyldiaminopimelate/putrescine aminotransferase